MYRTVYCAVWNAHWFEWCCLPQLVLSAIKHHFCSSSAACWPEVSCTLESTLSGLSAQINGPVPGYQFCSIQSLLSAPFLPQLWGWILPQLWGWIPVIPALPLLNSFETCSCSAEGKELYELGRFRAFQSHKRHRTRMALFLGARETLRGVQEYIWWTCWSWRCKPSHLIHPWRILGRREWGICGMGQLKPWPQGRWHFCLGSPQRWTCWGSPRSPFSPKPLLPVSTRILLWSCFSSLTSFFSPFPLAAEPSTELWLCWI